MLEYKETVKTVWSDFEEAVHMDAFAWGFEKNEKALADYGIPGIYKVTPEQLYKDYWAERLG